MISNRESQKNIEIKTNPYTEEHFYSIKQALTQNLFFIHDNGRTLETDNFFDLCIGGVSDLGNKGKLPKYIVADILKWFESRKKKIGNPKNKYANKKILFREFLEDYYRFFGLDEKKDIAGLSGCIQLIVEDIMDKSEERIEH